MAPPETKVCPYCAETIKAAAIKCRYCQSDLTGTQGAAEPTASPAPDPAAPADPAAAPATAPVPTPASAVGPGSGRRRGASVALPSGRGWVVAAAVSAAATVTFLVLAFLAWQDTQELAEADQAGKTVRASISEKVEALLSYDHETFDEDLGEAQEAMTSSFQEEYAPTVEEIRERAVKQQRNQLAEVIAVAVVDEEPEKVETLLFVNTLSATEKSERQRVMQNRVSVTMVKQGDSWLIDDLSVPLS